MKNNKCSVLVIATLLICQLCFFLLSCGGKEEKATTIENANKIPLLEGITIVNNRDKRLYIGIVGEKDTNKMRYLNSGECYTLGKIDLDIIYLQGKK